MRHRGVLLYMFILIDNIDNIMRDSDGSDISKEYIFHR